MLVFVRTLTGNTITIDIEASAPVDELFTKVCDVEGFTIDHMPALVHGGRRLLDGTLADYNIAHESTLYLVISGCFGGIKLVVRPSEGRRFEVGSYRGPFKVADVIADIASHVGKRVEEVGVAFRGVTLDPRLTLEEAGLQNSCMVEVVPPFVSDDESSCKGDGNGKCEDGCKDAAGPSHGGGKGGSS